MTRIWKILALVCLMSGCMFAQLTGSQIPDSTGERLYLLSLSNLDVPTQTTYLTNNAGLSGTDITTALNQVSSWSTAYNNLTTQYNGAVGVDGSGFNAPALAAFLNNQTTLTASTITSLQTNLTPAGWAALIADYQLAKNGMYVNDTPQTMGVSENIVQTNVLTVISPTHHTLTLTRTIEGESTTNAPGVYHTTTMAVTVGTRSNTGSSGRVAANQYVNVSGTVTLDDTIDTCLITAGFDCLEQSTGKVFCTMANTFIFVWFPQTHVKWFIAFTMVQNVGDPPFQCNQYGCKYNVRNWCTSGSTPPDADYTGRYINSGSLQGYWLTTQGCSRVTFPTNGPIICVQPGYASNKGMTQPLYSCTSHT